MTRTVDLNCDMGEGFGAWTIGHDADLMPHISSANIACGMHAGDPGVMHRTVRLAIENGVAIGAHPSLPDLQGFGRREMQITPDEAFDLVVYQVGALAAFASVEGARVRHVKPHGALYNMASTHRPLADAIARAVRAVDSALVLVGASGSALVEAGVAHGLVVASEVFADRTYQPDGTLTPRRQPGALVDDPLLAANRLVQMIELGTVDTRDGPPYAVTADTVCIHGDGPHALEIAMAVRSALTHRGIAVAALG